MQSSLKKSSLHSILLWCPPPHSILLPSQQLRKQEGARNENEKVLYETMGLHPPVQLDSKFALEDDVLPDDTFVKKDSRVELATRARRSTQVVECSGLTSFFFLLSNHPEVKSMQVVGWVEEALSYHLLLPTARRHHLLLLLLLPVESTRITRNGGRRSHRRRGKRGSGLVVEEGDNDLTVDLTVMEKDHQRSMTRESDGTTERVVKEKPIYDMKEEAVLSTRRRWHSDVEREKALFRRRRGGGKGERERGREEVEREGVCESEREEDDIERRGRALSKFKIINI